MEKKFKRTLFIFRRDLRLEDNTGLIFSLENSQEVIPAFIFTPEQVEDNPFCGRPSLQFMIESLEDLQWQLKQRNAHLYLFYGPNDEIIEQAIISLNVNCVVANRDYTPFSLERDRRLEKICRKHGITFSLFEDALLHSPESTLKEDGKPYIIFTPYYRKASQLPVRAPQDNQNNNYFKEPIKFAQPSTIYEKVLPARSNHLAVKGGRRAAESVLKSLHTFSTYADERDFPALNSTTKLSPYLKFTILSPREVYFSLMKNFGMAHELVRALHWRDFFSTIAFFFPHVFQGCFHRKFDQLAWSDDKRAFEKWCLGQTGFPIVDAGMRELNETGFMHNRVRMIVASFLTKDLHINWQWGEQYFAQRLIDYDPAVNNGNWQWSASTGCDAQPYFRIFNPWRQQLRFDPECIYIKTWVPELKQLPVKSIHQWERASLDLFSSGYPLPMVNHEKEAKKSLKLYTSL